jgi:hypothetical protein
MFIDRTDSEREREGEGERNNSELSGGRHSANLICFILVGSVDIDSHRIKCYVMFFFFFSGIRHFLVKHISMESLSNPPPQKKVNVPSIAARNLMTQDGRNT